jgi:hypothetical protein
MITIKKGIPLPAPRHASRHNDVVEAMRKMEVGDCIDLDGRNWVGVGYYTLAKSAKIKVTVKHMSDEKGRDVIRIWRRE